jgi:hypothetical protein
MARTTMENRKAKKNNKAMENKNNEDETCRRRFGGRNL